MKYKSTRNGQIVEIPDGMKVNPQAYVPVDSGQTDIAPQTDSSRDPNAEMQSLYQKSFLNAPSIKVRNTIASAYKTATGQELFGQTQETAEQKKAALKKSELENVMNLLEDKYNTKKLAKGRIGGVLSTILAAAGFNPDVTDYQTLRESIRPQLAKGAGDTGNLAVQEQEAAIKQIPTVYSTPEEAALQFSTARKKFGLSESQKNKRPKLEDIFK